jgi:hypothetical protein
VEELIHACTTMNANGVAQMIATASVEEDVWTTSTIEKCRTVVLVGDTLTLTRIAASGWAVGEPMIGMVVVVKVLPSRFEPTFALAVEGVDHDHHPRIVVVARPNVGTMTTTRMITEGGETGTISTAVVVALSHHPTFQHFVVVVVVPTDTVVQAVVVGVTAITIVVIEDEFAL